jgi:hypothetical protein
MKTERKVTVTGDGTEANPLRWTVDEALCREVLAGRWNTGMLDALARWALIRLTEEDDHGE